MRPESPPHLEEAYRTFQPLFFKALSRLTRRGYQPPVTESMDLIHSFFLEEWENVRRNYDPEQGDIEPYVFVAFTHFARRQIAKEQRRDLQLADHHDLERYVQTSEEESGGSSYDTEVLSHALSQLSEEETDVLRRFLQTQSERQVAHDVGTTRYRVRDTMQRALGRVALHIRSSNDDQWTITKEVLHGGFTLRQAASKLDMSFEEAHRLHSQNLRTLIRDLRQIFADTQSIDEAIQSTRPS